MTSADTHLLSPADIRALAEELGVIPTKKLGQNFVHDPNTVRRIVAAAELESNDVVLEVGPGLGSLTLGLLDAAERVAAVEIDARLAGRLPRTAEQWAPEGAQRLTVVNMDALDLGPADLPHEPTALVANLPYNVAVPVLLHLLEQFPSIRRVLVMVQLEVAERLAAAPGSKIYGVPSVKAAFYGDVSKAGTIGKNVFWPAPNIESGLIRIDVRDKGWSRTERSRVFPLVDAAFAQRRKTLRACLSTVFGSGAAAEVALVAAGIDPQLRGERLAVEDFVRLAEVSTRNTLSFSARAHGKVNLHLGVGEPRSDGYHDLSTVFMAVDAAETVTLAPSLYWPVGPVGSGSLVTGIKTVCHVTAPQEDLDTPHNLAWRAVEKVFAAAGEVGLPPVSIEVDKCVPVAGGMAGGSADAAAAVQAAAALVAHWGHSVPEETLAEIARDLGADVPFAMMGGVALGTERGDALVPMMGRGEYWFAFLNPKVGLSTGEVFEKLDDLRFTYASLVPKMDTAELSRALLSGDPHEVGAAMHNDLEPAALALRPALQSIIHSAEDAGAIRAMVSGSGPTIAALCADQAGALGVVDKLTRDGTIEGFAAKGPVSGASVI